MLTLQLLPLHLLLDVAEELELDNLLIAARYQVKRELFLLAPVDWLTKWILSEPLVQRLLARVVVFRVLSNREQRLGLLQTILKQFDTLQRRTKLLFLV